MCVISFDLFSCNAWFIIDNSVDPITVIIALVCDYVLFINKNKSVGVNTIDDMCMKK